MGLRNIQGRVLSDSTAMVTEVKRQSSKLTKKVKLSTQANTTVTLADITGLTHAVRSGKTYRFKAIVPYNAAATTTGSRFTVNAPAGAINYTSRYTLTATTETFNHCNDVQQPAAANATSLTTGNTALIEGLLIPTANGTLAIQFNSEVADSAITVRAGAFLEVEEFVQ